MTLPPTTTDRGASEAKVHSLDGAAPHVFELQRARLWQEFIEALMREPVEVQMVSIG